MVLLHLLLLVSVAFGELWLKVHNTDMICAINILKLINTFLYTIFYFCFQCTACQWHSCLQRQGTCETV